MTDKKIKMWGYLTDDKEKRAVEMVDITDSESYQNDENLHPSEQPAAVYISFDAILSDKNVIDTCDVLSEMSLKIVSALKLQLLGRKYSRFSVVLGPEDNIKLELLSLDQKASKSKIVRDAIRESYKNSRKD